MSFHQHVVEGGEVELWVEVELLRILVEERAAGVGDADDLDVGAMEVVLEESVNVAVDEADDGDAKRWSGRLRERYVCEQQDDGTHQQNTGKHAPPMT